MASFETLVDRATHPMILLLRSSVRALGQTAWLSACVAAMSFPLVWSQFHLVSLVSVITNVLVGMGLMVALPSGVLTVMLDPVSPALASFPGTICHTALFAMWQVIEWTASWPYGHAWLPAPSSLAVSVFYLVMAAMIPFRSRLAYWIRRGWIGLWTAIVFALATSPAELPDQTLEATFVDVGHGTSVIVRQPDGSVWLYDCGRMGNDIGISRKIDTALWSLGITRLDGVVLSHADADHYNALPGLLKRFAVTRVITPPGMLDSEADLVQLRRLIAAHQIPIQEVVAGDSLPGGLLSERSLSERSLSARSLSERSQLNASMAVLHPPACAPGRQRQRKQFGVADPSWPGFAVVAGRPRVARNRVGDQRQASAAGWCVDGAASREFVDQCGCGAGVGSTKRDDRQRRSSGSPA